MPLDLTHPGLRVLVQPGTIQLISYGPSPSVASTIYEIAAAKHAYGTTSSSAIFPSFFSIAVTPAEISVLATLEDARLIEESLKRKRGVEPTEHPSTWRAFKIAGPLDLSMVGVLYEFTRSLKDAEVPVFVSSTFLTDYILVDVFQFDRAQKALRAAGWVVENEQEVL